MGQSLSEPKTEKKTEKSDNGHFSVGASCMQGWRLEMEDAHCVELGYAGDPESAFFAVFDGHGGAKFAKHCSSRLSQYLQNDSAFIAGDYYTALSNSFLAIDRDLKEDPQMQSEQGGTTAIAALVRDGRIYCANAGDSRGVACVAGRAQELSHDHKPYNQVEQSRIYRAGGWVEFNRVNGNLALSRAIGDFNFKGNEDLSQAEQIVTANPEVIVMDVTPEHEFIVLACDGVWDVMSNIEVAEFIRKKIASNIKPPLICEALLDHCLAPDCRMGGVGCDNMTAIIACFMHGDGYGNLVYRCSRDSSQISRTRRLSLLGEMSSERLKLGSGLRRRMSEPPSLPVRSPVIPSNLTQVSDKVVLSNGVPAPSIPSLSECNRESESEAEREHREDEEYDELTGLPIPFETTL